MYENDAKGNHYCVQLIIMKADKWYECDHLFRTYIV